MKKQILVIWTAIAVVLLCVGSVVAQDGNKMDKDMMMDMGAMQKSPHHAVMMAYRQNVLTFAKTLRDMTAGGKLEDVELARNAFAEIKRSMEKMDEIHQSQMGKMKPEMMTMMKPMMEKMQAEQAVVKEHTLALEKALQVATPNAADVNEHAAALVMQLEKMDMSNQKKMEMTDQKKMDMSGKKKM
ncbi:MAG: hypothetical protein ABJA66_11120 [Actinomycetota bacterium]